MQGWVPRLGLFVCFSGACVCSLPTTENEQLRFGECCFSTYDRYNLKGTNFWFDGRYVIDWFGSCDYKML